MSATLRLRLVSSEQHRARSTGRVARRLEDDEEVDDPVFAGLRCQRLFGPLLHLACGCGRCEGERYQGASCDLCGVEVLPRGERSRRVATIELGAAMPHPWLLEGAIGPLLGLGMEEATLLLKERAELVAGSSSFHLEDRSEGHPRGFGTGTAALARALDAIELSSLEEAGPTPECRAVAAALRRGGVQPAWLLRSVIEVPPADARDERELGGDLDLLADWVMGHAEALGLGRFEPEERQRELRWNLAITTMAWFQNGVGGRWFRDDDGRRLRTLSTFSDLKGGPPHDAEGLLRLLAGEVLLEGEALAAAPYLAALGFVGEPLIGDAAP